MNKNNSALLKSAACIALSIAFTGCASTKGRQVLITAGVATLAGTIGAMTAPNDESAIAHALMWGGTAGSITAVSTIYIYDEESKRKEKEYEVERLKRELQETQSTSEPKLNRISQDPIYRSLPSNLAKMVRPGSWKLYEYDQWVEDGENRYIHQDKIFEITPSQLMPRSVQQLKGEE